MESSCALRIFFLLRAKTAISEWGRPFLKSIIPKLQSRLHLKLFAFKTTPKPRPNELLTKEKFLLLLLQKKKLSSLPPLASKEKAREVCQATYPYRSLAGFETKAARFKAA